MDTPRQIVSKWRQRFHRHALAASMRNRAAGVPLARWSVPDLHREVVAGPQWMSLSL